tara:strand:+ start:124 stop:759 length:636 start_codon:yes stop_codon:yes gene_type:complete
MKNFLKILVVGLLFNYCLFAKAEDSSENYLKGKFYTSVKNHLLIASNKMNDDRFKKTVIVILESDKEGAWGFVINKPIGTIPIALLVDPSQSSPEERDKLYNIKMPVLWGGPVETNEIYILHSKEYKSVTSKKYESISVSRDYKILLDIIKKKGPKNILIVMGYSGWGPGQLEGEMEQDHWVLSNIDLDIIFGKKSKEKWKKAYKNSFIRL